MKKTLYLMQGSSSDGNGDADDDEMMVELAAQADYARVLRFCWEILV